MQTVSQISQWSVSEKSGEKCVDTITSWLQNDLTSCWSLYSLDAPTFKCPESFQGREHESFSDKCFVMAVPEANVTWSKDGKNTNSLQSLRRKDSGSYVITAMNMHGTSRHRLRINVQCKFMYTTALLDCGLIHQNGLIHSLKLHHSYISASCKSHFYECVHFFKRYSCYSNNSQRHVR